MSNVIWNILTLGGRYFWNQSKDIYIFKEYIKRSTQDKKDIKLAIEKVDGKVDKLKDWMLNNLQIKGKENI